MRNFKELEVWKEGRILSKDIYLLTKTLPDDETQTQESNAIFKTKNNLKLCYENSLQKTQSRP